MGGEEEEEKEKDGEDGCNGEDGYDEHNTEGHEGEAEGQPSIYINSGGLNFSTFLSV